ncbi:ECF transporter S component [Clostridium felsineum]|uniref:Pantothenic acid transporter PanT n=1 Tax=Clostridium felsineum TaxID=36839 RepID=A0A1S8MAN6_9CLOT|nr:ECF transporter S component [Clostridium felsineum]URZ04880.1 Pantothenic acid transporter PanT [Clostridium felsineum]URZ09921.1 Pantothenic acid transporter PanT [Clostridium felsineum]
MNNKLKTRQLTVIGLLSAISIVLGLTGYGFIPLPITKATIMHVPVIIGAILEGPIVGAVIGLIFGLFSIVQNIMSPSLLSFAYMNPLVSVLPRVLIGVTAYYSYRLVKVKNQSIKIAVSAVVGTLTNTLGVLTMIYVLYAARYATAKHISIKATAATIYGVAATSGTCEAIVSVLITVPVVLAIKKIRKK